MHKIRRGISEIMPFQLSLNMVRAGKVGATFALLLLLGSWLPKLS